MKRRAGGPFAPRGSTAAAIGIAFALLFGSFPRWEDGPIARGSAFVSPIVENGVKHTARMTIESDVVAVVTLEHFEARNNVVVESITPLRSAGSLEILTMQLKYIYKHGVKGFRGYPGAICTGQWPPVRLVDFVEAPVAVRAGEHVGVTVFARPRGPGDSDITGVRIRYRENGVVKEQTTETTTLTVVARDSKSDLPQSVFCPPDVPHHELGQASATTPSTIPGA